MTENGLPCLDLLEATPGIVRALTAELSDADARWKPAPDRFSVAEVLAHLSHSDSHCYRMRLDRFMAENRPELEPDDAQMHLDLYRDADPGEAFRKFEEQRKDNIAFLRGLPAGAGDRLALHKTYGEITMSHMLNEWALHDLGHIRQIAELARARKYLAGAGRLASAHKRTQVLGRDRWKRRASACYVLHARREPVHEGADRDRRACFRSSVAQGSGSGELG